jgi:hypothetical protein
MSITRWIAKNTRPPGTDTRPSAMGLCLVRSAERQMWVRVAYSGSARLLTYLSVKITIKNVIPHAASTWGNVNHGNHIRKYFWIVLSFQQPTKMLTNERHS